MIESFTSDDAAYEEWLRLHPRGHVFNHFGGANDRDNLIHTARCRTLSSISQPGQKTAVPKLCSDSYFDLLEEVGRLRPGKGWRICSICS